MTIGDPRPARRVVDRRAGVEKVRHEGKCRACGLKADWWRPLNRAHLISKGQRGDDVDENIVPLCGSGTNGCHGALTDHSTASDPSLLAGSDWRIVADALRRNLTPEERSYVLMKKGYDWLDRVYPFWRKQLI